MIYKSTGIHKKHKKYDVKNSERMVIFKESQPLCLLVFAEQSVVHPQGEVQGPGFVVLGVGLQVLDDVCEEVGPLHTAARSLVA